MDTLVTGLDANKSNEVERADSLFDAVDDETGSSPYRQPIWHSLFCSYDSGDASLSM